MAFEFPTRGGALRLLRTEGKWAIEFNGRRRARRASADDAVMAALLRWRPTGENL